MKYIARGAILFLLLALPIVATSAQDDDTINVTGSRTVIELLQSLLQDAELNVTYDVNGSTGGFTSFCAGDSDLTTATRPISVDEETSCLENGVTFDEYLIGYSAVAFIASPDVAVECVTTDELNGILSPAASGVVMNWEDSIIEGGAGPLSIVLPPDSSAQYFQLDQLLGGLGLRTDMITVADSAGVIETVADNAGAIGLINAASADSAEGVTVLQFQNDELGSCFSPSLEAIESRQYSAVDRLFVYVKTSEALSDATQTLLSQVVAADAAEQIASAGFLAPSDVVYATNAEVLAGNTEGGRQFTKDVTAFRIPDAGTLFGTINVAGASSLASYLQDAGAQFSSSYPSVTITPTMIGEPSGRRALCNDQASLIGATRSLPAEDVENCAANNIETYEIDLGVEAVVLLSNTEDTFLECLTTAQVQVLWGIPADGAVATETWNQVNADFPEQDIALVATREGAASADLMLTSISDVALPLRTDADERNADPEYRAAAVANVPGATTFMTWPEYQEILEAEQSGVKLISVDNGSGCVLPTEDTILNGTYPISRDNKLIINRTLLTRPDVQSFVWFLFSDENYSLIEDQGFIGLDFAELPALREEIQAVFNDVIAEAATPDEPESTAEPAPEETPEATTEATEEAG